MSKSFRGYVPIEKPEFELMSPDGTRSITVKCVAAVPGSRFLDFMAKIDDEDPATMADAVYGLLTAAIQPDAYGEFKDFIDEPDNGVSIDLLADIAGYLSEVFAKRPTAPSPG